MPQLDASFGHWLKTRRKALDLTQRACADLVGCAAETVRKIEANRLRPSRVLAERFAEKLMLPAHEHAAIVRLARRVSYPDATDTIPDTSCSMPLPTPLTTLIGRSRCIVQIRQLLDQTSARLLTLLGPPGVGKTHLSLQFAAQVCDRFAHGACFVPLAALHDASLVQDMIAQALQLEPRRLHAYLRDRQVLLILDNCEHVLDAAAQIAELLAIAPQLMILATSRAPLKIAGEQRYVVPPLELPDLNDTLSTEALATCPAVELFVRQARAVWPGFVLHDTNACAVAEICVELDGLPLAIELAAARSHCFAPQLLRARLDQQFDWLIGGSCHMPFHQRALRDSLDWSYKLLDRHAQQLFIRLGVFVGSFSLAMIEGVCIDHAVSEQHATGSTHRRQSHEPVQLLEQVASLLDQNLIQHATGLADTQEMRGSTSNDRTLEPCYTFLRVIRAYARRQLKHHGQLEIMHWRHALYYLALAEEATRYAGDSERMGWLKQLDREYSDVRQAMRWVWEQRRAAEMLRLTAALEEFWLRCGYADEGRLWTRRVLALADTQRLPPALQQVRMQVAKAARAFA
ncbi:MAG TPA: helix-turn-helix domain-containing protein [Roseiflexaceae bacterium]|nr:helix-turn-helix domain-containing protein [Roseiflexaceae bacterium]HMP40454.1 helix-turn-helix domain-containing protein [Roseiflexaceae bacterium]